jgi:outer membrane protein TolC
MRLTLLLTAFLWVSVCFGQQNIPSGEFSFDEFRQTVLNNHPLARQAKLQEGKGEAQLRKVKGNFDPKLEGAFVAKQYGGKEYFNLTNATLMLPTPFAAELKSGFDMNSGFYLNPEDLTPKDGLWTAGISMPLLQGLVIDERRAQLRMAKAYVSYTQAERDILINELLLRAFNSYWEWWAAVEKLEVAQEMETVTRDRFQATKSRAIAGQAALIDTVEAFMILQTRMQQVQEAKMNETKARWGLSSFVWKNDNAEEASILSENNTPSQPMRMLGVQFLQSDSLQLSNPALRQYQFKLAALSVEEKWKREKLKPKFNLNYNLLSQSTQGKGGEDQSMFSTNNYKWGMDFSFPILIRESRGDLALQRIKIQETQLEFIQKAQDTYNKASAANTNLQLMRQQLILANQNVSNLDRLLNAEKQRFFEGESSLFLVNQRELQYIDGRNKVVDLNLKIEITTNELGYLTGKLQ